MTISKDKILRQCSLKDQHCSQGESDHTVTPFRINATTWKRPSGSDKVETTTWKRQRVTLMGFRIHLLPNCLGGKRTFTIALFFSFLFHKKETTVFASSSQTFLKCQECLKKCVRRLNRRNIFPFEVLALNLDNLSSQIIKYLSENI